MSTSPKFWIKRMNQWVSEWFWRLLGMPVPRCLWRPNISSCHSPLSTKDGLLKASMSLFIGAAFLVMRRIPLTPRASQEFQGLPMPRRSTHLSMHRDFPDEGPSFVTLLGGLTGRCVPPHLPEFHSGIKCQFPIVVACLLTPPCWCPPVPCLSFPLLYWYFLRSSLKRTFCIWILLQLCFWESCTEKVPSP